LFSIQVVEYFSEFTLCSDPQRLITNACLIKRQGM